MPAKGYLKPEQREKLQKALKEEENAEIRERILILLLLNDGKTQEAKAELIGCAKKKISYWCVHADVDNLESLKDKRMEGNYKKATPEYIELLLEIVDKDPKVILLTSFKCTTAYRNVHYRVSQASEIQLSFCLFIPCS